MGDNFPDHVIVNIEADSSGKLTRVPPPPNGWPNGEPPFFSGVNLATYLAQDKDRFPKAAALQTNPAQFGQLNTLGRYGHDFVYMDCGRWGGPTPLFNATHRDFGLVNGRYVALCEFVPNGSAPLADNLFKSDDGYERATLINDFIKTIYSPTSSIRIIKTLLSTNRLIPEPDKSKLHLIIPDMHLPVNVKSTPPAGSGDGLFFGRYSYLTRGPLDPPLLPIDNEGFINIPGVGKRLCGGAQAWFGDYKSTNIFGLTPGSPGGADTDLLNFLDRISKSSVKGQINFVHIGDMYDYWIGLECFFKQDTGVNLLDSYNGVKTEDFLNHWADVTHSLWGGMIDHMHQLPTGEKNFLWGNHDNYLAKFKLTRPAGSVTVPQRIREVRSGGIYIEHGQRVDPSNKDGETSGVATTNLVFKGLIPYSFDPQRRNYYFAGSAAAYCGGPDFGVYVMGHTHERYLTNIWPVVTVK